MLISVPHTLIPRIFCLLSLVFNGAFCLLVKYKSTHSIGGYRFLLMTFAAFNTVSSTLEAIVSLGVEGFNKCLVVFVANEFLSNSLIIGQILVIIRCAMIAFTYGLLGVHFIYRYLSVAKPMSINVFFQPFNILRIILFVFLHGATWCFVGSTFLWPDTYLRGLVDDGFQRVYGLSSNDIPMIVADYRLPDEHWNKNGIVGMFLASVVSTFASFLYVFLAVAIRRLVKKYTMSELTRKLHHNLLRALIVQTVVPIVSTFMPCSILWYIPFFSDSAGRTLNTLVVPFLSFYPAIDPIVITLLLTDYRKALIQLITPRAQSQMIHETASAAGSHGEKHISIVSRAVIHPIS